MDTTTFNKDIEVSFINVAYMAAEAKRNVELEAEAKKFFNRSTDEMSAAVALILMRYQTSNTQRVPAEKTPELVTHKSLPFLPRKLHASKCRDVTRPNDYYGLKTLKSTDSPTTPSFKAQTHGKLKLRSYESKSSLLSSCRNILKDFLNQNRNK